MIYMTSDLHFCHNKPFLYEPRGFQTIEEMNEAIVKNWNDTVRELDEVYILGDLMLNDNREGMALMRRLNGQLHLVLGNHDTTERANLYRDLWNVVDIQYGLPFKYGKYRFFLSHYPSLTANYDDGKPLKRQVINLCGHSHTQDRFVDWDKGLIYHVEMDAHGCAPVSIEEIISDIRAKVGEE